MLQGKKLMTYFAEAVKTSNSNLNIRAAVKSRLDGFQNKDPNFQFNIYLCWLLAWSATLRYQDRKEKMFLVLQAIEICKRIVYKC